MEGVLSIYQPLECLRGFSLLDLLLGQGDDQIRCALSTTDLALSPEYYALSYTWGSDDEPLHADVNGMRQLIQKNLHEFLLHLRIRDKPRTVWVDSIRISQNDVGAQNKQVPLMR